ncbi:DUF47 family protein [Candidatus Sumerlaeota bacterium]|nr:DUF47 family protein [Candidatus Sumerlaeota bacterium]
MKEIKSKKGILNRLLPKEHDFYSDLIEHTEKVREGVASLVEWFKTHESVYADRVREKEHEADDIQLKIAFALGKVFITPLDREDIHQLASAIDQIINYAKNTVREVQIFDIKPDAFMIGIAELILEGTCALCDAVKMLSTKSSDITELANKAVKCEHRVEKLYRQGLNALFEGEEIKEILKRREVYRHLSNTADRINEAAEILSMIMVKYG